MSLMRSVSGLRGVVGSTLLPETIIQHVSALVLHQKAQKIVLGGDSRVSGPWIRRIASGVMEAMGIQCIDIGICPTPTVQLMTEQLQADGGIAVTASHNPVQWNGLKFIGADGLFLPGESISRMYDLADSRQFEYVSYGDLGHVSYYKKALDNHIQQILALPFLDIPGMRSRKFKVAVDTVNGAGGVIIPQLLKECGCEVIAINSEPTGLFAHTPEPLPENLGQLCIAVKENQADVGIAVDPDVDRCALVDNTGTPLGEEYTLALAVKLILQKKLGPVAVNMSTSSVIEDLVKYYNSRLERTPVGEIHVAQKMREIGAVIGGEGNGGVILPDVHLGRDAPVAVALVLQTMLEADKSIREIKNELPQYKMIKDKIALGQLNPDEALDKIKRHYSGERMDTLDGIKIYFNNSWVHLRKSNTEPIIRIISEAPDLEQAKELALKIRTIIAP